MLDGGGGLVFRVEKLWGGIGDEGDVHHTNPGS